MDTGVFFIKGLVVGFLVAAPVGPVAVMCIHRTITGGKLAGYICALGATLGDTLFGAIAALGVGIIAHELMANRDWLQLAGGGILCVLGLRLLLARHLSPRAEKAGEEAEREEAVGSPAVPAGGPKFDAMVGNFASAFIVMVTNPITLISFATIFAAIDIANVGDDLRWGAALVLGVFIGGALWWSLLISICGIFHKRIDEGGLLRLNRVSGALILACGVVLLVFPGIVSHGAVPTP
jgi:threonine/homoserine/homoserine lactone efflux protein